MVSEVAETSLGVMATEDISKDTAIKAQTWRVSLDVCSIVQHGDPGLRRGKSRRTNKEKEPAHASMQGKKQWEKEFKARIHSPKASVAIGFSKPHL